MFELSFQFQQKYNAMNRRDTQYEGGNTTFCRSSCRVYQAMLDEFGVWRYLTSDNR